MPTAQFQSRDGRPFVAVALGPDSVEGRVSVNGSSVMAGHVVPIVPDLNLQVVGYVPQYVSGPGGTGTPTPPQQSTIPLQIYGLHTQCEVDAAADMIRAPLDLDGSAIVAPTIAAATFAASPMAGSSLFWVPFSGRYRCLFQIQDSDTTLANFNYAVVGQKWSPTISKYISSVITTQLGVNPDAGQSKAISFYVEDETWDQLVLYGSFSAAPTNANLIINTRCTAEIQS